MYSALDVNNYIKSLGIRILSCFDLTHSKSQVVDNKSFRICIVAEDKAKLCDGNNWDVGVVVREWVHKPKTSAGISSAASTGVSSVVLSDVNSALDVAGAPSNNVISANAICTNST